MQERTEPVQDLGLSSEALDPRRHLKLEGAQNVRDLAYNAVVN